MRTWCTAITTIAIVAVTTTISANEILDAWWGEIGNGLVRAGVSEDEARRIFNNIDIIDVYATEPGSWFYEFKLAGDVHHRRAEELELSGTETEIIAAYERANAYYSAACWPALFTAEREEAYRLQLQTFMKIVKHRRIPMEVVKIPYEGKEIVGHFYTSRKGPTPVIIWSGGLDGWKTAGLEFKQTLMEEGFAVFAVDLPGTGESHWPLAADSDRIYERVIDYLKTRSDVNDEKITAYFGSFSGVYAIKLALTNPDLAAAVNHSGGIHLFFTRKFDSVPPLTTSMGMRATALIHAAGLKGQSVEHVLEQLARFSLKNQGLLKPTSSQAPLLSIYGTADALMPVEDLNYMQDQGVLTDALVYEGEQMQNMFGTVRSPSYQ